MNENLQSTYNKMNENFIESDTNELLSRRKELFGSNIYVNEDLTRLNRHVMGTIRKQLQPGEKIWTRDGQLFLKNNAEFIRRISFSEYKDWLGSKWPQAFKNF